MDTLLRLTAPGQQVGLSVGLIRPIRPPAARRFRFHLHWLRVHPDLPPPGPARCPEAAVKHERCAHTCGIRYTPTVSWRHLHPAMIPYVPFSAESAPLSASVASAADHVHDQSPPAPPALSLSLPLPLSPSPPLSPRSLLSLGLGGGGHRSARMPACRRHGSRLGSRAPQPGWVPPAGRGPRVRAVDEGGDGGVKHARPMNVFVFVVGVGGSFPACVRKRCVCVRVRVLDGCASVRVFDGCLMGARVGWVCECTRV